VNVSRETSGVLSEARSRPLSEAPSGPLSEAPTDEALRGAFGEWADAAVAYHDLLAGRGIEWGLVGPREAGRLWSRHIWNSVAVGSLISPGAGVLDVGSGAGLPGIPLALARPDLKVTLLDSQLRRTQFLQRAVEELALTGRVKVVRARAEDLTARFDVVVSRAVAPLGRLVDWCEPLMGGCLLAIKGAGAEDEVRAAAATLRGRGLTAEIVVLPVGATVVRVTRA